MLQVIAWWGACPNPDVAPCDANFDGNYTVKVTDLLLVVATWHTTCPGVTADASELPQDIEDCDVACDEKCLGDPDPNCWNDCMEDCLSAVELLSEN